MKPTRRMKSLFCIALFYTNFVLSVKVPVKDKRYFTGSKFYRSLVHKKNDGKYSSSYNINFVKGDRIPLLTAQTGLFIYFAKD